MNSIHLNNVHQYTASLMLTLALFKHLPSSRHSFYRAEQWGCIKALGSMSPASNGTRTPDILFNRHPQPTIHVSNNATLNRPIGSDDIEVSEMIPRSNQTSVDEDSLTLNPPKILVSENGSVQTLLSTKVTTL